MYISPTAISMLISVLAIFACMVGWPNDTGIGWLLLIGSAAIFIRGNRVRRERTEERRHQEMLAAVRRDADGE